MSAWILLRGLTRETRHWGAFPDLFGRALGATPFAADMALLELPGNGAKKTLRAPFSVDRMMASVRSAAADQGLRPPYGLLAMSLGGMVATAWAQRYPSEIERLVLINTSMQPFCRATERLRPAAWPALARLTAAWTNSCESERLVHALTCNRRDTLDDDIANWAEIRRTASVNAANGLRQLWAAACFRAEGATPCCPALLLSSAEDRLVNPVCSARIASQWGAAHVVHPWAGHDLPHDDPQWTSHAIIDWLRGLE